MVKVKDGGTESIWAPAADMSGPISFEPYSQDEHDEIVKYYKVPGAKFAKVGEEKVCLPSRYDTIAADIYNFGVRPDDVWICTIPRSGTTVTQELIWCISKDLDFEAAKSELLLARFPQIEQSSMHTEENLNILYELTKGHNDAKAFLDIMSNSLVPFLNGMKSPRFIKSHLKFELLPPKLVDTCKVFYICRNPKDAIVSYFHFNRIFNFCSFVGEFPQFWDMYRRNIVAFSNYWQHVADAWKLKDHPNMCFLFYEEVVKDQKNAIKKIATHLGKTLTEEDIQKLMDHVNVENFRNNKAVNLDDFPFMYVPNREANFIRKGKTGGWVDYFTPELNAQADEWIAENMAKIPGFEFYKEPK